MKFFKNRIKKYQEKKLLEAQEKLKFYSKTKAQLERNLELNKNEDPIKIKREIKKNEGLIKIWKNNVESINKQIRKLNS